MSNSRKVNCRRVEIGKRRKMIQVVHSYGLCPYIVRRNEGIIIRLGGPYGVSETCLLLVTTALKALEAITCGSPSPDSWP